MRTPDLSIVIPCYNHGQFIDEALVSIEQANGSKYEVIIVNDGSNEENTIHKLHHLTERNMNYKVIHQANKGLSGARNTGIQHAAAEIILLLDADNMVLTPYMKEAVAFLKEHVDYSVVYGNAIKFGAEEGLWEVGDFNLQRLMIRNYIDACAVVRKSALLAVGGYDENMRQGCEDWDMWLRLAFDGYKFHYLNKECFKYRVASNSMSASIRSKYDILNGIENYLHKKYPKQLGGNYITADFVRRFKRSPIALLVKIFLRVYFPNYYLKLLSKNKIRNGI